MAIDINAEAQRLQDNRLMENNEQIAQFEEALEQITNERNPEHIALLCRAFDDDTEHHEVMYSMVHAVERYDEFSTPAKATAEFVKAIPSMLPHASEWLETLLFGILNEDASRRVFAEQLANSTPTTQEQIVGVLRKIAAESPDQFQAKVDEILATIS